MMDNDWDETIAHLSNKAYTDMRIVFGVRLMAENEIDFESNGVPTAIEHMMTQTSDGNIELVHSDDEPLSGEVSHEELGSSDNALDKTPSTSSHQPQKLPIPSSSQVKKTG